MSDYKKSMIHYNKQTLILKKLTRKKIIALKIIRYFIALTPTTECGRDCFTQYYVGGTLPWPICCFMACKNEEINSDIFFMPVSHEVEPGTERQAVWVAEVVLQKKNETFAIEKKSQSVRDFSLI